jgi:predicted Zn-dependent protease
MKTLMTDEAPARVTASHMSSAESSRVEMTVDTPREFLSREECHTLLERCMALSQGGGDTRVAITSTWSNAVRWARNRAHLVRDTQETEIVVTRTIRGADASVTTTRLDEAGLREAVQGAELGLTYARETFTDEHDPGVTYPTATPTLWSQSTYQSRAEARASVVQSILDAVERAGLSSAGEVRISASGTATVNSDGLLRYYPTTAAQFSSTVRDPKGTSSGWAGQVDYDLARIDVHALAQRALDKCKASASAVAIEPGRYTTILEPQAVADLFQLLVYRALDRRMAEQGNGPFAGTTPGTSKIGEAVLDQRLTLSADPMDPLGGFVPFRTWDGAPYPQVNWIDHGVLHDLSYERWYALPRLGRDQALPNSYSFRLSGGTTSVDEMIKTTERGLLVTRFSGLQVVDFSTMLCSGYTRDGLWLIERGAIRKAVKNLRFTESPLFAFNQVEQLGPPTRVFSRLGASVTPAAKVRDFSFTGLSDAV